MKKIIPPDAVLLPDKAECKFKGVIYDTYQWQQEMFDGSQATFEMLKRADTVSVVCIDKDKILVLKDEQPHRGLRVGFPGGRVDESDTNILSAAQREVLEETGYEFNNWKLVRVWQPQTKIEWFIYLFIASDALNVAPPHLDAGEKIVVDSLSFDDTKKLVMENVGYMGEAQELFKVTNSLEDILQLVSYQGIEVNR